MKYNMSKISVLQIVNEKWKEFKLIFSSDPIHAKLNLPDLQRFPLYLLLVKFILMFIILKKEIIFNCGFSTNEWINK